MTMASLTYRATLSFPKEEQFGLTSQMRSSAVSVAGNIAEGAGRGSDSDDRRFLRIAYGSACELETQARIAQHEGMGEPQQINELIALTDGVRQLLAKFIQRLGSDGPAVSSKR